MAAARAGTATRGETATVRLRLMSIPRRLGRLARGFYLSLQDDERFQQTLRVGRERGETMRETFGEAFGAAWRGAAEEWRTAEEETASSEGRARERGSSKSGGRRGGSTSFIPRKYPLKVLSAYRYLGLEPGVSVEEVHRRRRDLIKRHHPDRFSDPGKRDKAEEKAARINAAHDAIVRHAAGK